ncbi:MAG: hypothetical protein IT381_29765 [Deltaproteobacteria bacterium]|nr:hypothetical protein [Deltaproteobacteria bacterium]
MLVRLHDVLAYLSSARGRDTLVALQSDLEKDGAVFDSGGMDPPLGNPPLPVDKFEAKVTRALYEAFYDPGRDLSVAMPAAIVTALAEAADKNGVVDTVRAKSLLGVKAQKLLGTIAARTTGGADASSLEAQTMSLLDVRTKKLVAKSAPVVTANTQVYTDTTAKLGAGVSLARFECFGIGELQPQTQDFVRALSVAGLPAAKTHWLSDPPRTHAVEVERMRGRGVDVLRATDDSGVSEAAIGEMLSTMFRGVKAGETKPRFLLIDEDGRITRYLHDFFPQHAHLCVIVEQRGRAADFAGVALKAPVVTVADSSKVSDLRSALAGERAVAAIERQLRLADPGFRMSPKEAVVEGFFERSRGIVESLKRRGYTVFVATEDAGEAAAAKAAGLSAAPYKDQLAHARLTVLTAGKLQIDMPALQLMPKGAIIASATPRTLTDQRARFPIRDNEIEIDATNVIHSKFQGRDIELGRTMDRFQHEVVRFGVGDDRLWLRFGSDIALDSAVPGTFAQVDGAATLAAVFDAVRATTPGARALSDKSATIVRTAATARLAALGLDPLRPSFR